MIDSHCHLTYPPLASQLDAVLSRAASAGVERMITIGTKIDDARQAVELCRRHSNIRAAVGIHPHHAAESAPDDIAALEALQRDPNVLALGEMGLDYHYDFSPRARQRELFVAQLELAKKAGCPIVIHCREALDDCMAILKDFPTLRAVFHCFTGTAPEARRILDAGYLIGLTGVVTFKRSDELRQVAGFIPDDRLLLETDAPYLAPEPHRKQRVNEPALVVHTAAAVAWVRNVSVEEIDRITSANALQFLDWK